MLLDQNIFGYSVSCRDRKEKHDEFTHFYYRCWHSQIMANITDEKLAASIENGKSFTELQVREK